MSLVSDFRERARALLSRRRNEREVEAELRFHVECETEAQVRDGHSPEEARRRALVALGGVERRRDEVREARGVQPLDDLTADMRYALRGLRRNPGFALAAILVLGLGIGSTTLAFSAVDTLLLAGLPYANANALVRIYQRHSPVVMGGLSAVDYFAIREQQKSFVAFGAVHRTEGAVAGAGRPERLRTNRVTPGFFTALGLSVGAGRLLEESDATPGAPPVAVVTHDFAVRGFGAAKAAVGRPITIEGVSHEIVGVLAAGMDQPAGLRAPVWPALSVATPSRRGPFTLIAFARLKPGVTVEAASADLAGISERIFPAWAASFQGKDARLTALPLRETIVGDAGHRLSLFGGAVFLVLLIAIANVATLMLVRASSRGTEMSVREALGAARGRLVRLVLTECLVLSFLAGVAGVLLARAGIQLLPTLAPELLRVGPVGLDYRSLAFAVGVAVVSGVLVSLSPLSLVFAGKAGTGLRADERRGGTSRRTNVVRGILVGTEFALALPLLLGAALLLNSFLRLQRVDLGFVPNGVQSLNLALPQARYPDSVATMRFWQLAAARAASIPGITAFGWSTDLPPDNQGDVNNFDLVDHPVPAGTAQPLSPWMAASKGYFDALGVSLLEGRWFLPGDTAGAPPVVLVSRSWAHHYFPTESAVGKRMIGGGCTTCPPITVIGVVGDVKYQGLAAGGDAVYEAVEQATPRTMTLVWRTSAPSPGVSSAIQDAIRGLDSDLPLTEVRLEQRVETVLLAPRRWASLLTGFAVVAILLAALGILGLMSYVVRQRRREIGVRMALGAEPGAVAWMIVRRGMRYALIGTAAGLGVAVLEARWLNALLFDVHPLDVTTMVAVALLLLIVALVACWLPGRHASRMRLLDVLAGE